ncbi:PREDICTED: uncharacterized protein LOC106892908 [Calidris pugnax]|uniref:uncharacterized protein LOC106892908 n=1 Tax=Calidris pugnax TaxID=198806 RepID=UPI00071D5342|nr:PREDICTED: uncharacterized protein LOC106892908 [Calidris pugnax]
MLEDLQENGQPRPLSGYGERPAPGAPGRSGARAQPSAAPRPPRERGFLCSAGAAERCPKSRAARSAANWGQLGRVLALPPPDEALAAAPGANGGKRRSGSQELPQLHCIAPASLKGEANGEQTDHAPSLRLQLSSALLASSPACQLLLPSKLSPMLCCRARGGCFGSAACPLRPPPRRFAAVERSVSLSLDGCRSSRWELPGAAAGMEPARRDEKLEKVGLLLPDTGWKPLGRLPAPPLFPEAPKSPAKVAGSVTAPQPAGGRSAPPVLDGASGGTPHRTAPRRPGWPGAVSPLPACRRCPARRVFFPFGFPGFFPSPLHRFIPLL